MKVFTTILIILILWYIAGIFRQTYIMALAVCIGLLIIVLNILCFIQKKRLSVSFRREKMVIMKNSERAIALKNENRSRLPVNRYRLTLKMKYSTDSKPLRKKLFGCSAGRSAKNEDISEFFISAPYCGVIEINLAKLRVYDPTSVFHSTKKLKEKGELLVFPAETKMNILTPSDGSIDDLPMTDTVSQKHGDDHSEIRQIREYRPGDLTRYIHRNYSARTDSVWVKEFCKENDRIIDLYLDTSSPEASDKEWLDAFYELVFSSVCSLLDMDLSLCVHWYDGKKGCLTSFEINSRDDCPEMLGRLYLADKICDETKFTSFLPSDRTGIMLMNTRLEWYFSGRPVCKFNRQNISAQLASNVFRL